MATEEEAKAEVRDARSALFRERRVFVGLSLTLTAIHGLNVEIVNTISLSGLTFNIEKSGALVWAIWIAWAWSILRYFQYHSGFTDTIARNALVEAQAKALLEIAMDKARKEAQAGLYEKGGIAAGPVFVIPTGQLEFGRDGVMTYKNLQIQAIDPKGLRSGPAIAVTVPVTAAEFARSQRGGVLTYHFRLPYTLDYFAPYAFAVFPVAAAAIQYW